MVSCPKCNYTLVLLEHRRKYKCPRCSRLYNQKEIETKEFVEYNKRERKADKEAFNGKPQKQKKITEFEKRQMSRECQRKFRKEHRCEYNKKKRIYWEMNHEHLLEKRKENYKMQKAKILEQQRLYRLRNIVLRRINNLRKEQKLLAQHFFEFDYIKPYNTEFKDRFPTLLLS